MAWKPKSTSRHAEDDWCVRVHTVLSSFDTYIPAYGIAHIANICPSGIHLACPSLTAITYEHDRHALINHDQSLEVCYLFLI